jgi:hypothetical protein
LGLAFYKDVAPMVLGSDYEDKNEAIPKPDPGLFSVD